MQRVEKIWQELSAHNVELSRLTDFETFAKNVERMFNKEARGATELAREAQRMKNVLGGIYSDANTAQKLFNKLEAEAKELGVDIPTNIVELNEMMGAIMVSTERDAERLNDFK